MTDHPAAVERATEALAAARAAQTAADEKRGEAVEARNALRARVANGDEQVTGADLADADQAVELAELRSEAAAKRVEAEEDALHQAEVDRLRADVESLRAGAGRDQVAEALELADDALQQLAAACDSHQVAVRDLARRAADLKPLPDDMYLDSHGLRVGRFDVAAPKLHDLLEELFGAWEASRGSIRPPLKALLKTYATPAILERYDEAPE